MARSLHTESTTELSDLDQTDASSRIDQAAARAFAAAVSALIISTLVVFQSAAALEPDGTVAGNSFAAGTVALVDDDNGRSLVNLQDMAPGRPIEQCISVVYEGTILPVSLTLDAQVVGDLGPFLDVEIDSGTGGGFGDCAGFVPEAEMFTGTLEELSAKGVMDLGSIYNSNEAIVYRFRFELRDESEAVGRQASLDFVWEATP